jgi:hypothetical protein
MLVRSHLPRVFVAGAASCLALGMACAALARSHDRSSIYRPTWLGPDGEHASFSLADVDGDGLSEWVGAHSPSDNGYDFAFADTSFTPTRIPGARTLYLYGSGTNARYAFTGRFSSKLKDTVCVLSTGLSYLRLRTWIDCYESHGGEGAIGVSLRQSHDLAYAMPRYFDDVLGGYAVGDFDGDGYDEVLTYDMYDGSDMHLWRYDLALGEFAETSDFDLANMTGFSVDGGGAVSVLAGDFGVIDGGVRRDAIAIYSNTTGLVWRYDARKPDAGKVRFWWAYTGLGAPANQEATLADADGDGRDDLVMNDTATGQLRFFSLARFAEAHADGAWYLVPLSDTGVAVSQGQVSTGSVEQHVLFGKAAWFSAARQDIFTYQPATGSISRYDAHDPSSTSKTYYWAWTWGAGGIVRLKEVLFP